MSDTVLESPTPTPRVPFPRRRALVLALVVALLATVLYGGKVAYDSVFGVADYSGSGTGQVLVQIQPGDSAAQIGSTLVARGVVKSKRAFTKAAKHDSRSRTLQPGFYSLHLHMSGPSALALLLDP